jgi:hypothetical protein
VCDKFQYPSLVSAIGNAISLLSFTFIGPLPFLPSTLDASYLQGIMVLHAFGIACVLVSTFTRSQLAAKQKGYQQDISTYLFISGRKIVLGTIMQKQMNLFLSNFSTLDHIILSW